MDPATAVAIATASLGVVNELLGNAFHANYSISGAVTNLSGHSLDIIEGIKTHHGQYNEPPVSLTACPKTAQAINTVSTHLSVVTIDSTGARCSEAVWGYTFQRDHLTYQVCLYLKHGKHVEAGCAIWEKGRHVKGQDYDAKIKSGSDAVRMLHCIRKNEAQTEYSKDGAAKSLTGGGLKVSFSSGKKMIFKIENA